MLKAKSKCLTVTTVVVKDMCGLLVRSKRIVQTIMPFWY